MSMLLKVQDNPSLVRDSESKAILNTNVDALEAYKKRKNSQNQITSDINSLKSEVSEIKAMLQIIVGAINGKIS